MKGANGEPLKVVPKIAAGDYMTFGMCLLQDDNGDEVELIKRDHKQNGAESVTQEIIKRWLKSDALTRTYCHLIECLRDSELGALADDIATAIVGKGNHKILMHINYKCVPPITQTRLCISVAVLMSLCWHIMCAVGV